jgi:hypothetical protein
MPAALWLASASWVPAGCAFGGPESDASSTWTVSSIPADGARDVARSGRFVVQLDRRVTPRHGEHGWASLRSGTSSVPGRPSYDPLTQQIWIDVDPRTPLAPATTYVLRVEGLVDLDGVEQDAPFTARFTTGRESVDAAAESVVDVMDVPDAQAVLTLLRTRCGQHGCHGGPAPATGLDLSSPQGVANTAIGALSSRSLGTVGEEGADGSFWLEGLRIIDVAGERGDPARSYIVYKVLGDPHVLGEPMPPVGPPLERREIAAISAWIRAGAPLPE